MKSIPRKPKKSKGIQGGGLIVNHRVSASGLSIKMNGKFHSLEHTLHRNR